MKKMISAVALTGMCVLAKANNIDAPSSLIGYETLNGNYAYSWNVDPNLAPNQDITAATITFTGVTLNVANSSGHGYLYTDLLNSQAAGLTSASDNDASGDYWKTQFSGGDIMSLGTEYFSKVGKTLTWSYTLSNTQLAELNTYLVNGSFNIGIDPDCHFSVSDITFCYTVCDTQRVPDAATTALLLGSSLLGLEVLRRRTFAMAK